MREQLDVEFIRRLDTVSITENMLVLAALGQAGFARYCQVDDRASGAARIHAILAA